MFSYTVNQWEKDNFNLLEHKFELNLIKILIRQM